MIRVAYRSIFTAVLLVLSTSAFSKDTLCSPSENVVFSCPVERGKTISVCASPDNKNGARIIYRFGTSNKVDLELTADTSLETTVVEYNHELSAREYNTFVRFKSGEYAYTVQQRWDGCPSSPDELCKEDSFFAGVTVYKSGKRVTRRECSGSRSSLQFELLNRFHIPVSNQWPE